MDLQLPTFQVGDQVFLIREAYKPDERKKLASRWIPGWTIVRKLGPLIYIIKNGILTKRVHASKLKHAPPGFRTKVANTNTQLPQKDSTSHCPTPPTNVGPTDTATSSQPTHQANPPQNTTFSSHKSRKRTISEPPITNTQSPYKRSHTLSPTRKRPQTEMNDNPFLHKRSRSEETDNRIPIRQSDRLRRKHKIDYSDHSDFIIEEPDRKTTRLRHIFATQHIAQSTALQSAKKIISRLIQV